MDFLHILTQMLMILGIVLVGLFAAKRNLWSGDLDRKLSIFIMNISMPALILAWVRTWLLRIRNCWRLQSSLW